MATSEAPETYDCPNCDQQFSTRSGLGVHHSSAHGMSLREFERQQKDLPHDCPSCTKRFETKNALHTHHSQIHGEDISPPTTSGDVECPYNGCTRTFENQRGVAIHHKRKHGESIAGSQVECAWCSTEKRVQTCEIQRRTNFFCNRRCQAMWRWSGGVPEEEVDTLPPESLPCSNCGDPKPVRLSYNTVVNNVFCDLDCRREWRSENWSGDGHPNYGQIEFECSHCGERRSRKASAVEAHNENFCGRGCYQEYRREHWQGEGHPSYAGGSFPYGPGWNEKKKEAARKAADYRCEGCGFHDLSHREHYGRALHVHHKMKARHIDDPKERNGLDNLAALCTPCHATAEKIAPLYPFAD